MGTLPAGPSGGFRRERRRSTEFTPKTAAFRTTVDPFGFGHGAAAKPPVHPSGPGRIPFSDQEWMAQRSASYDRPVNIYELHLGSWKKAGPRK